MASKTPVDKLSEEVRALLDDYSRELLVSMDDVIKSVSKAGAKALRAQSKQTFGGSGKYAKGWTYTVGKDLSGSEDTALVSVKGRRIKGIIYNKDVPGLPHLLEYGHLNRNGARTGSKTPGRPHISKIEDWLVENLESEMVKRL